MSEPKRVSTISRKEKSHTLARYKNKKNEFRVKQAA